MAILHCLTCITFSVLSGLNNKQLNREIKQQKRLGLNLKQTQPYYVNIFNLLVDLLTVNTVFFIFKLNYYAKSEDF